MGVTYQGSLINHTVKYLKPKKAKKAERCICGRWTNEQYCIVCAVCQVEAHFLGIYEDQGLIDYVKWRKVNANIDLRIPLKMLLIEKSKRDKNNEICK